MRSDIDDVRTAAIKFLNTLHVRRRHHARRLRHRGARGALRRRRLSAARSNASAAASPTAGRRSTTRSASTSTAPADQDGQKILVLYTDGGDTRSSLTFRDVLDLLKASDVTVYAIGYLEHQSGRARERSSGCSCSAFAEMTGGQAFFPVERQGARQDLREDPARDRRALQPRLPLDRRPHRRRLAQGRNPAEAPRSEGRQAPHPRRATSRPSSRRDRLTAVSEASLTDLWYDLPV